MTQQDETEAWRTYLLIAREMNLTIVEEKIDRHRYRLLEEFHADCLNILHNMVIYNGGKVIFFNCIGLFNTISSS